MNDEYIGEFFKSIEPKPELTPEERFEKALEEEEPVFTPCVVSLGSGSNNEVSLLDVPKKVPFILLNTHRGDLKRTWNEARRQTPTRTVIPILLGKEFDEIAGRGVGGNVDLGYKALEYSWGMSAGVKEALNYVTERFKVDTFYVLGSLGHGTGSNLPLLIELMDQTYRRTLIIPSAIIPFRVERQAVIHARQAIRQLNGIGYSVGIFDNQRILDYYMKVKHGQPSINLAMDYANEKFSSFMNLLLRQLTEIHPRMRFSIDANDLAAMWTRRRDISLMGSLTYSPQFKIGKSYAERMEFLAKVSHRSAKARKRNLAGIISVRTMFAGNILDILHKGIQRLYGGVENKIQIFEEPKPCPTELLTVISGFELDQLRPKLSV